MTGYAGSRGQCKFGDSARGLFAYQRASFACACNGARCNQIFPRCSSCAEAHPARTVCRRVNRWRKLCRIPSPYSQVGTAVWHRRLFRIWSGNMRTWVAAGASNGNVHGHLARGMEPWSCWPACACHMQHGCTDVPANLAATAPIFHRCTRAPPARLATAAAPRWRTQAGRPTRGRKNCASYFFSQARCTQCPSVGFPTRVQVLYSRTHM